MEDAYICEPNLDNLNNGTLSVFGVFDGHGGISIFAKNVFQGWKWQNSSRGISFRSLSKTKTLKIRTTELV